MPPADEEAQLEQTKMSFGEHLEELRRAVFKSLIALAVGFAIGLCVGMPLVNYIQEPLTRQLVEYKHNRAVAKQLAWLQELQAAGKPVPADLQKAADEAVRRGGTLLDPHEYLVSPEELKATLRDAYPELADTLPASVGGAEMIRLRLYEPIEDQERLTSIATNSFEPMVVYLKASFAAGLVLSSPFIFYFLWEFVAAGLYKSERRYVHVYLPFSLGLFIVGAALAYYFALDYMLNFLFWFHEKMGIEPYPKLSDWITTVVLMPLGFGVSFQLPLVMLLLERLGVLTVESYVRKWRIAVVVIAVAAMILTPGQDLSSMLVLFVALTGLYFLGILLCKRMPGGPLRSPLRDHPSPTPPRERTPKPEDSAGS
jgi:sec-independent protein translocase protein TatC